MNEKRGSISGHCNNEKRTVTKEGVEIGTRGRCWGRGYVDGRRSTKWCKRRHLIDIHDVK